MTPNAGITVVRYIIVQLNYIVRRCVAASSYKVLNINMIPGMFNNVFDSIFTWPVCGVIFSKLFVFLADGLALSIDSSVLSVVIMAVEFLAILSM